MVTKKDADKAIADLDEAIRFDPSRAAAYALRAAAWQLKNDPTKALADLNECLRIDPKCRDAIDAKGSILTSRMEYEKAIAFYSDAIRDDPQNNLEWFIRARLRPRPRTRLRQADCRLHQSHPVRDDQLADL